MPLKGMIIDKENVEFLAAAFDHYKELTHKLFGWFHDMVDLGHFAICPKCGRMRYPKAECPWCGNRSQLKVVCPKCGAEGDKRCDDWVEWRCSVCGETLSLPKGKVPPAKEKCIDNFGFDLWEKNHSFIKENPWICPHCNTKAHPEGPKEGWYG